MVARSLHMRRLGGITVNTAPTDPRTTGRSGVFGDGCATCGKPIYNGLFCSIACATAPLPLTTERPRVDTAQEDFCMICGGPCLRRPRHNDGGHW